MTKKWYHSKVIWVNGLAAIAGTIQVITGTAWLDVELQAAIIVVANFVLRLVTKQGLGT